MKVLAHSPFIGTTGYNSHCQNFFRRLSKYHELKIRNFTIGKHWKGFEYLNTNPHGEDVQEIDKNILALQTLWTDKNNREDYEIYGFKKKTFQHDINIVLSEVNHHYFYDNYLGPKIAYTAWESTLYPENFFNKLKEYDQVWVPSKWQADITIKQGISKNKVKVVPEGVDIDVFYPENFIKNKKFTFVVFGRWDARKSTKEIINAFKNVFGKNDNVELLISVDNPYPVDGLHSTEERLKFFNLECDNIKVLHFLSREDYVRILKSADVFLSCSRSEGWNLPLIEAMACGIPSVYSNCSAQLEYAQDKGIPISIVKEKSLKDIKDSYCEMRNETPGNWYEPDFKDLENKILDIYKNYSFYKDKALKESIEIAKDFNWDKAVEIANKHLLEFDKNLKNKMYNVHFEGIRENNNGIYYRSSTDDDVKIEIKVINEISKEVLHQEILYINNKCNFYTDITSTLSEKTIFQIADFYTREIKLEYRLDPSLNLFLKNDDLLWHFESDQNKLIFSFNKDYENARIILKELNSNLKCFDWKADKFEKNINYYIIPTQNLNLYEIDFQGFVFDLYCNNQLLLTKKLKIKNSKDRNFKFYSDKDTDLNIKDSFYLQYSDFYNKNFIHDILKNKNTVVDLGASCGSFVDICLRNKVSKIIALEPSDSFKILKNTFNKENVICLNKAISVDCQDKEMYFSECSTLSTFNIEPQKYFDTANLINSIAPKKIQCVDLKNLIQTYQLNNIDLLKIDIEGYEYDLFESLDSDIFKFIDEIICEFHHNINDKLKILINKLKINDYSVSLLNLNYQTSIEQNEIQGVLWARKKISIINESGSLGDTIAWFGAVNKFANDKNITVDFYSPYKEIFEPNKLINFLNYQDKANIQNNKNLFTLSYDCARNDNTKNLQKIAFDILKHDFFETKPPIKLPNNLKNNYSKKYVCISTQSTAQFKYWNNKDGWQKVVDYLQSLDYEVVCIDRYENYGIPSHMNTIPKNCINKTGDYSLMERINDLYFCDFFIGLSSGLSWLAWALNKKVILISGISNENIEFSTNYRVTNTNVCHSCTTEIGYKFDSSDWLHCVKNKNFECTKEIYFEDVKKHIDSILNIKVDFNSFKNFNANTYTEIFVHNQYELFQKINKNDTVLDLGCSKGYLYFKNKYKNINYIGIDASIDCLNDFILNLSDFDNPILLNLFLSNKIDIISNTSMFHENKTQLVNSISFSNLIKLINKKIDFLKFDIEGYEYCFLDENYELFKKNVRKFSGEVHFCYDFFPRFSVYKVLQNLKNDPDISLKIYSVNGIDITDYFWTNPDFYTEIIINGCSKLCI